VDEPILNLIIAIEIASACAFVVGLIMSFFENKKKLGLKIMSISAICFVIGFGTCFAQL
jgi:hypothetical protein